MSALTPTGTGEFFPKQTPPILPEVRLHLHDTLAAGQRLWVRGRVAATFPPSNGQTDSRRWWPRRPKEDSPAPTTLSLETRVGGSRSEHEVAVLPDGRFEAAFTVSMPASRRGWRMARNRVTYGGQTVEACNVVLLPPAEATAGVVVVLPQEATVPPGNLQRWAASESAEHLPQLFQKLQSAMGRHLPIYYLASVALDGQERQAELALAATALSWPVGHFILVPTESKDLSATVLTAVDRLRWLFAGTLDLWVHNLEPAVTAALAAQLEPQPDRADAQPLSGPAPEPGRPTRGHRLRRPIPRPTRAVLVPRHPIVFCHGMLAYSFLKMQMPEDSNYFAPLRDYLRERGLRVFFPQVPPTSGVAERARQLRDQILGWTDEPVNLIAHSMGGLDARYLIAHLDMAEQVRSLTTICTPHRGSYLADWFQDNFRQRVPLLLALEAFGVNVDGFKDLGLEACKEFNRTTPDMPGVRYFSYGGEVSPARLTPFLRRGWSLLSAVEGPNDGLVSVASARWGEYLGTIMADHFAQTPDAVFLRDGENFDSLGFFSRLVEDLARRGF